MNRFFRKYAIARRLPLVFDAASLDPEVRRLPATWWQAHLGPYHDGGWEAIALLSPGGDFRAQTSRGGAFAPTEALTRSPSLQAVIDAIPGEKNRVRLMRLRPGAEIFRHSDPLSELDPKLVRLHVPVITNDAVDFRVDDRRIDMRPGELWHVDVRFPHQVRNGGSDVRVHLVADVVRNAELEALLAGATPVGEGRLTLYFAKHLLPRRVLLRLGWAN
jgi:mannose-6-phosphate isomerase-like protein (cupin superfamily)